MQTHNMKLSMSKFDLTDALMIVGLSPFTALKFAAIVSVELSSRNHLVAATLHLSMGLFNPLPPPPLPSSCTVTVTISVTKNSKIALCSLDDGADNFSCGVKRIFYAFK